MGFKSGPNTLISIVPAETPGRKQNAGHRSYISSTTIAELYGSGCERGSSRPHVCSI